ncbi:isoaspartyl dipeptidase [Oxobacter pfennigii]|uniref:Isoaspartyl dipeptidase n=1 Tax=Oxobacter pfennigii TaxID=36849 RepID=A0A0P8WBQ4_9CLOT|nr:beta-aspartyl-peptidase [Oxobacter pfennigii]KPU45351.1 isoaspartyl dipeptidase [Oxobacter pfennigii]
MLKIIKDIEVYSPEYSGKKDVLLINDKIGKISDNIDLPSVSFYDIEVISGEDKILTPGFIDGHVHITGGGGEGGFTTRTPEAMLTDITSFGITTVVGCLGTDGTTRHMAALLAKARALEEEGITTYIYTGSYEIPTRNITDNSRNDIILIDKIIGIGEIAISDHRSAQPTTQDILRLAAEARVGGMLSGKAGVLHLHVGDGKRKLSQLFEITNIGEIPPEQMVPTHINRTRELLYDSIKYAKSGGYVDITSSIKPVLDGSIVKPSTALKMMLINGVPQEKITMSSDGNGSSPEFDSKGNLLRLGVGSLRDNHSEFCDAVFKENIPVDTALMPLTSNPADVLKLSNKKGRIQPGLDADIILMNKEDLSIDTVIAKGKVMVKEGKPVVFGTFEKLI